MKILNDKLFGFSWFSIGSIFFVSLFITVVLVLVSFSIKYLSDTKNIVAIIEGIQKDIEDVQKDLDIESEDLFIKIVISVPSVDSVNDCKYNIVTEGDRIHALINCSDQEIELSINGGRIVYKYHKKSGRISCSSASSEFLLKSVVDFERAKASIEGSKFIITLPKKYERKKRLLLSSHRLFKKEKKEEENLIPVHHKSRSCHSRIDTPLI